MNDEQWVEERLRALDPAGDWRPNSRPAWAELQRRDWRRRNWRRGWLWSAAMLSACAALTVALPAPAKCALIGVGCARPVARHFSISPQVVAHPIPSQPVSVMYKEIGLPGAPVVCEIYSDYECPSCASFYTNVFPQFETEFVKTGRVRVVHRDFPLPQHPFAMLAARYANAAGETGHYEEAVGRLFASQPEWARNGDISAALAHVLPPETMRKIEALVKSDAGLDKTIADDLAMVARDKVNQTPTIVFVYRGTRRKVAGPPSYGVLRNYLQEMLAQ